MSLLEIPSVPTPPFPDPLTVTQSDLLRRETAHSASLYTHHQDKSSAAYPVGWVVCVI